MYSLYELGKYDEDKGDIRRQRFIDRFDALKKSHVKISAPEIKPAELNAHDFSVTKLKQEIQNLNRMMKIKDDLIAMQKQLIETLQKGSTQVKPQLRKN